MGRGLVYSLLCLCGDEPLDGVLFLTSKTGNMVIALRDCIMIIQEIKIKFHNFRIEKLNIKKLTRDNQPSVLGQPSLVQSYLQVQYT